MNELEKRYYVFIGIFVTIALIYIIKLFSIQVLDDKYAEAAKGNYRQERIEYPFRGLIYDRNGKLLVYNEPIFDLMVVPREVKIDTNAFCDLLKISKNDFNINMQRCKVYSRYKPSIFLKQLSSIEMAKIEDKLIEFTGFYPQVRTVRKFNYEVAPHVLGYVAEISKNELEKRKEQDYSQGDYIGKAGIEAFYEPYLKGKRGKRFVMVNVKGVEKGKYDEGEHDIPAIAGENLVTTLDIELQEYLEQLLDGKTGSAVAIEPSTGEILAFVSVPGFNPNLLTGRAYSTNYAKLNADKGKVLFNRAIMADQYPPGSIFKTAQALIGLQEKVIYPSTRFQCNRSIISCHGPHSNEDLTGAITHSCNPYFWNVFKRIVNQEKSSNKYLDTEIGLILWKKYLESMGFNLALNTDLENIKTGQIPGNDYYNKLYGEGRWKFSTIYSLAIGQGEIGVYPLQMANFTALLANRGYYITPHLVKNIDGINSIDKEFTEKKYSMIDSVHFKPIIDGMQLVVEIGTGVRANLDSIVVCGKTGTSQNPHGEDHSVFIAFAPRDNPKIAIAVYVENAGQGARAAASIAGLTIEKYLNRCISDKRKYIEDYVLKNHFIY